jgi:hypothetical protein
MRTEQEFLADILGRLNRTGVAYMLTGSMASNVWGIPRTTHDLDFVVVLQPTDVDRFASCFEADLFIQRESIRSAFKPPHQFNVLDQQSALKADFWQLRDNSFEQEMFRRRVAISLFGRSTWIATPEDVILHKLYWNRITPSDRQLHDAAGVFAVQTGMLDLEYVKHWAGLLDVSRDIERLISGELRPKDT